MFLRYFLQVLTVFLLCSALPSRAQEKSKPLRSALVIGNGNYPKPANLKCPPNDSKAIAAMLRKCGFTVSERHDLDKAAMEKAVREFGETLAPGGDAFVYFSGHGFQIGGENYLVPVDAPLGEATAEDSVSVNEIHGQLKTADTAVNVVILDCCRDTDGYGGTAGAGVAKPPKNTVIAYAAAPGESALEPKAGGLGPYSSALVRHLDRPGAEIIAALRDAAADVEKETDGAQQSWVESGLNPRYYLNPADTKAGGEQAFADGENAAAALTFAREFLSVDERNDPGAVLPFYAPELEQYFGRERVPCSEVVEDRRAGIAKTPNRRYQLVKDPAIVRTAADGGHTIVSERLLQWEDKQGKTQTRPAHVVFKARPKAGGTWEIYDIAAHRPRAEKRDGTFTPEEIEALLIAFDSADEEDDPMAGMKYFAAKVTRYFSFENPKRNDILKDRTEHRLRWPDRAYRPQSYRVIESKPGFARLEYTTNYTSRRGGEVKNGTATNLVTVVREDGEARVASIQAVPKKKKG